MRCDLEMVRDGFVGREHELFDQAVRDVAFGAGDGLHQPEFVEFDDRLGRGRSRSIRGARACG